MAAMGELWPRCAGFEGVVGCVTILFKEIPSLASGSRKPQNTSRGETRSWGHIFPLAPLPCFVL